MLTKTHARFQFERLAYFSDAVFAIAITLLVIEIRVPHLEELTNAALGQALLQLIPKYIGFLVSFFVIGRFWLAHHRVFGLLASCDEALIARNLVFLMIIAFGPFPTALVSDYVGAYVAIAVYAIWLMLAGLMNRRLTVYVAKTSALWASDTEADTVMRYQRGSWSPVIIGAVALLVGLIEPVFALGPLMASPLIVKLWGRWYVERLAARDAAAAPSQAG